VSRVISWAALLVGITFWNAGCSKDDCIDCADTGRDTTPPAVPTGVFSVTGDGQVTVYWNDLDEADLAGYAVYRSLDGATYHHVRDLGRDENFDEDTGLHHYVDTDVTNGSTYYYAVTSFDSSNNESAPNYAAYDTPRPAGTSVELFNPDVAPALSGFDFSALESGRVSGNSPAADIGVVWEVGTPFVESARPSIVSLQDYGTVMNDDQVINLDWVSFAPLNGYSTTGRAELILGHAYVVRITESPTDVHYAKFAVTAVRTNSVVIDWAYQQANDNRELKAYAGPPAPSGLHVSGRDIVRF
jgi:hypothetical protein